LTARVLLISTPRSGSTWAMRMLACAPGGVYVHEPDNVDTEGTVRDSSTRLGFGPYPVLEPGSSAPQYAALWDLAFQGRRALRLRRGVGRRVSRLAFRLPHRVRDPLLWAATRALRRVGPSADLVVVSSVMAHFAAEWIADRFRPRVVVLQRNPLNVASSWLRLEVTAYDVHVRPAIVRDTLAPLGIAAPPQSLSRVGLIGWWIGALAEQLRHLVDRHPDWLLLTHDMLCVDAQAGFRRAYGQLGLAWTAAGDRYLSESGYVESIAAGGSREFIAPLAGGEADAVAVRQRQVRAWEERLTEEEVAELREVLAGFPNQGWVRAPQADAT